MPRYVSLHTLYNVKRHAAEDLAERLRSSPGITVRHALLNLVEGKLLLDWEAANRETIERWVTEQGFEAPDFLVLMEYEIIDGEMLVLDP